MHGKVGSGGLVFHLGSDVPCIRQDGVGDDEPVNFALSYRVVAAIVGDFSAVVIPLGSGVVDVQLALKDGNLTFIDLNVLQWSHKLWRQFCSQRKNPITQSQRN